MNEENTKVIDEDDQMFDVLRAIGSVAGVSGESTQKIIGNLMKKAEAEGWISPINDAITTDDDSAAQTKLCKGCVAKGKTVEEATQPLSGFSILKDNSISPRCRKCKRIEVAEWNAKNNSHREAYRAKRRGEAVELPRLHATTTATTTPEVIAVIESEMPTVIHRDLPNLEFINAEHNAQAHSSIEQGEIPASFAALAESLTPEVLPNEPEIEIPEAFKDLEGVKSLFLSHYQAQKFTE